MASSWVTIKEAEARRLTAETQTKLLAKRIKDLEDEMMMSTEARQAAMTRLREEEEARVAAEVRAGLRANKLGGGLGQRGRGAGGRVRAGGGEGGAKPPAFRLEIARNAVRKNARLPKAFVHQLSRPSPPICPPGQAARDGGEGRPHGDSARR